MVEDEFGLVRRRTEELSSDPIQRVLSDPNIRFHSWRGALLFSAVSFPLHHRTAAARQGVLDLIRELSSFFFANEQLFLHPDNRFYHHRRNHSRFINTTPGETKPRCQTQWGSSGDGSSAKNTTAAALQYVSYLLAFFSRHTYFGEDFHLPLRPSCEPRWPRRIPSRKLYCIKGFVS